MRKFILIALLLAACTACQTTQTPGLEAKPDGLDWRFYFGSRPSPFAEDPIVADAQRRAVSVISSGGACSGGIGATGIVLTASHCSTNTPTEDIFVNGQIASVIVNLNKPFADDLLFLRIQTEEIKPLDFAEPKVDMEIFEVVIQGEYRGVVKRGRITSVWGEMFTTDIQSIPGSSGAFVYSKDGKLAGIITQLSFGMVRCISGTHIRQRIFENQMTESQTKFNYGSM